MKKSNSPVLVICSGNTPSAYHPEGQYTLFSPATIKNYNSLINYDTVRHNVEFFTNYIIKYIQKRYHAYLTVEDICLCDAARICIQTTLLPLIFLREYLDAAIAKEKPGAIVLLDDRSEFVTLVQGFLHEKKMKYRKIVLSRKWEFKGGYSFLKRSYLRHMRQSIFSMKRRMQSSPPSLKSMSSTIDALFLISHPATYRSLLPLIRALRASNKTVVVISHNLSVQSNLKKDEISYFLFSDFRDKETGNLRRISMRFIHKAWSDFRKQMQSNDTTFMGISFNTLFYFFEDFFLVRMVQALESFLAIKYLLKKASLQIVLVGTCTHLQEKPFIFHCSRHNIPSITLQHGSLLYTDLFLPLLTTKMALWDKTSYKILRDKGVDPQKLVITGNPRYDSIIKKKVSMSKEKIFNTFHLDLSKKLIIIFTSPAPPALKSEFLEAVLDIAKLQQGVALLIKVHPEENFSSHTALLRRSSLTNIPIVQDFDTLSLINAADIIISMYSTVIFESILMDKDILLVDLSNDKYLNFVKEKVVLSCHSKVDIQKNLHFLLSNPNTRKSLAKNRAIFLKKEYPGDGKSTERVLGLMDDLVRKKQSGEHEDENMKTRVSYLKENRL